MNVFNISTSEIAISKFLAWILNPRENHGCDDYFLKYFLIECVKNSENFSIVEIDSFPTNNAIVKTEENFSGKKADITIRIDDKGNGFLCFIENKVKSSESVGQTQSYVELAKKKYKKHNILYVFLTPSGDPADSNDFISISYQEIKNLLEQTIEAKKEVLNEEIVFLIGQFIQNLEVNILDEGKIRELCEKIYERHKQAIDKIISYKPDYIKIIETELFKKLDREEWDTHPTKGYLYVFKKDWLTEFQEFSAKSTPFFTYLVSSWSKDDLLNIAVIFYIEKDRGKGLEIGIRKKFSDILDTEIQKNTPKDFEYSTKNIAVKFKEVVLDTGYENDEELKEIAAKLKKLIDETITQIENTVEKLKKQI